MCASRRNAYRPLTALVRLWVAVPFVYGLYELIRRAAQLFTG
ncbi:MFS transporter small subunit [Streptomyces sp. NPDC005151]